MKQFHCLKNEKICTSYLCTSIIHAIRLTFPFPLQAGFRSSFDCSLGKPDYWLQAPSRLSYTRQKLKEHFQHKQLLFTSVAHIWKESGVACLQLRVFSPITLLGFLTVVPSGFLLDKELPQASRCQMYFTQSPKIGYMALNLHPLYPNICLDELHVSKTLVLSLLKFRKATKKYLPHMYII